MPRSREMEAREEGGVEGGGSPAPLQKKEALAPTGMPPGDSKGFPSRNGKIKKSVDLAVEQREGGRRGGGGDFFKVVLP